MATNLPRGSALARQIAAALVQFQTTPSPSSAMASIQGGVVKLSNW